MSYVNKSLGFATHKKNRKFNIKVRLSFNEASWNRDIDSSPRFFLDPVSIVNIESIAFTSNAMDQGKNYRRQGYRMYDNVADSKISEAQVEAIFEDLKNTYPYGYRENDSTSKQKYVADVRDNDSFQAHYANYWNNNLDKVIPVIAGQVHKFPYIEFETSESIVTKHNKGVVPSLEVGGPEPVQDNTYMGMNVMQHRWNEIISSPKVIDVSIPDPVDPTHLRFHLDDVKAAKLVLDSEDEQEYTFRFVDPWPVDANGVYSGISFRLSESDDGVHALGGAGTEYFDAYAGSFDHATTTHVVTVDVNGYFKIDGVQGATLTLERGSEYIFDLSDSSYDPAVHIFHISTSPVGGDGGAASYCHVQEYVENGAGVRFRVPFDAPSTLYYQCSLMNSMGGTINIATPAVDFPTPGVSYSDFVPGKGLNVVFPQNVGNHEAYSYYSTLASDMGSLIFSRDCNVKCPGEKPDLAGISTWDPTDY